MKYEDQVRFLHSIVTPRLVIGIRQDLSAHPDWFHHTLRMRGLYIHGRVRSAESLTLASLELDVHIFNETFREHVTIPRGYVGVRIRDTQDYTYQAALRIPPPPRRFPWLEPDEPFVRK